MGLFDRIASRKLRIAWSIVTGICCVLVVVLWVRSYWWQDVFAVQISQSPMVGGLSCKGGLVCGYQSPDSAGSQVIAQGLYLDDHPWLGEEIESKGTTSGYSAAPFPGGRSVGVPHYFALIVLVIVTALPWAHWQFSLQTLLIVTTLVAVLLGLIVYFTRG